MQKRHTDRESYFDEQSQTSKNYYIPYIKEVIGHIPDKVLEGAVEREAICFPLPKPVAG